MAYTRPRSRRAGAALHRCQDCSAELVSGQNWTPSNERYRRYICGRCHVVRANKYLDSVPGRREEKNAKLRAKNAARTQEQRTVDKEKAYNKWLRAEYGVTLDQYNSMLLAQGNKCAICRTTDPRGRGRFHVDHCHSTKRIRAILCSECNMMIGLAKDSPVILRAAARYVERHAEDRE